MKLLILLFCCAVAFGQDAAPADPSKQTPAKYGLGLGTKGTTVEGVEILSERASEYFNFMARSEGTAEIELAELRESLQPEIDRQISIWVNLARLEMLSAFGNIADVHAAMHRLFHLCERKSGDGDDGA